MYSIHWLLLMLLLILGFLHERKKNTTRKWEWGMEEAELPPSSVLSYLFLHEELHSPSGLRQLSLSPPRGLWIRNSARPWVGSSSASYCLTWLPPVIFLRRLSWSGGSILVSHLCLAPWWEASPCGLPESMLGKSSSETWQLGNPHRCPVLNLLKDWTQPARIQGESLNQLSRTLTWSLSSRWTLQILDELRTALFPGLHATSWCSRIISYCVLWRGSGRCSMSLGSFGQPLRRR